MLWFVIVAVAAGLITDALITHRVRSRGLEIRGKTRLVALSAALWGLITALLFVPAGALLALVLFGNTGPAPILAIAVSALCVSGLIMAFDLWRAPMALVRGDLPTLRRTARFIAYHHIGVVVVFAGAALLTGVEAFALTLVCCAIGELIAWILMSSEGEAALPIARTLRRKV